MELNTAEQLLLLAKHPEKYRFKIDSVHLQYGIIGACFLELSLKNILDIKDDRFIIINKSTLDDSEYPGFKRISNLIDNSRKERKPRYWIQKISHKSRLYKWEFLNGLEKKKLIRIEHRTFLWIPYRRCYLTDSRIRNKLIDHLREIILYKKKKSEKDIAILGMVEACKMYKIIARDRHEIKTMKKELKTILKDGMISQTLTSTIKQTQIAISSAIAAATTAATAGAS